MQAEIDESKTLAFWVGVGCQRQTPTDRIAQAIAQVCQTHNIAATAILGIATLDRKAQEPGLLDYCRDRQLPLYSFTAAELSAIEVPHPGDRVATATGTASVAEAAALLAAELAAELAAVQLAAAPAQLWVPKQIFRYPEGCVTIAVACRSQAKR
jgi:cobalt-precorrin 5A hydrolase / precorrin-3B C17-methyltransferase